MFPEISLPVCIFPSPDAGFDTLLLYFTLVKYAQIDAFTNTFIKAALPFIRNANIQKKITTIKQRLFKHKAYLYNFINLDGKLNK